MHRAVASALVLSMLLGACVPVCAGPLFSDAGGRALTTDDILRDVLQLPRDGTGGQPGLEPLQRAVECFREQKLDAALAAFDEARQASPALPPPHLMLARLLLAGGQLAPAREALEQAAVSAPDDPGVYLVFGDLALFEGRLTDAVLHFRHAGRLSGASGPSVADARNVRDAASGPANANRIQRQIQAGLAAVAERRRDWPSAAAALTRWLALEPDNALARQRLGRVLFHLDRRTEAFETLRAAAELDPALEPAAVTMAWHFQQAGNSDKADEWMEYALKSHPADPRVTRAAALRLLELGRAAEAGPHVARLRELEPASPDVPRLEGLIARHLGDYARAERIFEELHRESPGDFAAANQLALVLIEQSDERKRQRALQLAEVNARQYPQSAEALATLGWVYCQLRMVEAAEQVLEASVTGGEVTSEAAYYLAQLLIERGRREDARKFLSAALQSRGVFPNRHAAQQQLERLSAEMHPSAVSRE